MIASGSNALLKYMFVSTVPGHVVVRAVSDRGAGKCLWAVRVFHILGHSRLMGAPIGIEMSIEV